MSSVRIPGPTSFTKWIGGSAAGPCPVAGLERVAQVLQHHRTRASVDNDEEAGVKASEEYAQPFYRFRDARRSSLHGNVNRGTPDSLKPVTLAPGMGPSSGSVRMRSMCAQNC